MRNLFLFTIVMGASSSACQFSASPIDSDPPPVSQPVEVVQDRDGDGFSPPTDCNDGDENIYPGAPEFCGPQDHNCDGTPGSNDQAAIDRIDVYEDRDADGFGNALRREQACEPGDGFVDLAGDCDDLDSGVNPGVNERCGVNDLDCNGKIGNNDPGAIDQTSWFRDSDSDGFGDPNHQTSACLQPPGYVRVAMDCADTMSSTNPDAPELPDALDNDCDGLIDETFRDDVFTPSARSNITMAHTGGIDAELWHDPTCAHRATLIVESTQVNMELEGYCQEQAGNGTRGSYDETYNAVFTAPVGCTILNITDADGNISTSELSEELLYIDATWEPDTLNGSAIIDQAIVMGDSAGADVDGDSGVSSISFLEIDVALHCPSL